MTDLKKSWDETAEEALARLNEWLTRWPTEQHWLDELQRARASGEKATYDLLIYAGFQDREARQYSKPDYKPPKGIARIYADPANRWKGIVAKKETIVAEQQSRASYRVGSAMYETDPARDYLTRQVEAREVVDACGLDNVENIIGLVKQGKTKDEIVRALKKNDGSLSQPSPQ